MKSMKKELTFKNSISECIATELQRYDHIREDEAWYRELKMESLLRVRTLLEEEIKNRAGINFTKNLENKNDRK